MNTEQYIAEISKAALARRPTVWNTYRSAKKMIDTGVEGDFVECGVFAGTQIAAMWRACHDTGQNRKIHLFDSFQGVPPAVDEKNSEAWRDKKKHFTAKSPKANTASLLQRWDVDFNQLVWHEGWFSDTLPKANIEKISVFRVDVDIYESTVECLKALMPKVVPGAIVIVDDWALKGPREAWQEYFNEHNLHPELHKIPDGHGPEWFEMPHA